MSENEKISTKTVWAKQLKAISFVSVTQIFFKNKFINDNKKPIGIYLFVWLLILMGGFWIFQGAKEKHRENFYNIGITAAKNMAEKINSPLLENDVLTLNVSIGELTKKIAPVFAAILDHSDTVIAHSDPYAINHKLDSLTKKKSLAIVDTVAIEKGLFNKSQQVIFFSKDLFFSKVKIGTLIFGLDAQGLEKPIASYNTMLIVLCIAGIILLAAAIFLTDIYLKKKKAKEIEAFEKMNKVGPYILKEKIAQGGMAELYLAEYIRDDGFKRTVAIKKILPHLAHNQDFVDMFIREARLAAMLQHPNIVQIYDLMRVFNASFMAMEYINGKNLAEIMVYEKKGLPVDMALFLVQKISAGLYYSHSIKDSKTGESLNIVHRDVSPQNILISFKGEVKISDFGISKAKSEPSFTQAGVIKGKLSYLSPEQALGKEVDHQADLYSLGIIFYEILTGTRLYRFNNELEAIRTIPTLVIPPVKEIRPDVPDELNDILIKCLKKDKSLRYQTCKELHDDLVELRKQLHISFDMSNLSDFMASRFRLDGSSLTSNDDPLPDEEITVLNVIDKTNGIDEKQ